MLSKYCIALKNAQVYYLKSILSDFKTLALADGKLAYIRLTHLLIAIIKSV